MHSLRTKLTLMTAAMLIIVMAVATVLGVVAIKNIGDQSANQTLTLLCEAGEKNLNTYFNSVEQSVEMVLAYVESDLDGLDDQQLQAHLDRVSEIFQNLTFKTNGIKTYYYRIDPSVSSTVKGFWYVNTNDQFQPHEVTDITLYDTEDTSQLVWFTVPKATGDGVWLPPYITDNLDVRVISYNVPVYYNGRFIGVIGIELDYSTMAEQVDNITLYENGYAFLNDAEGNIIYHPYIDVTTMETPPAVPEGLLSSKSVVQYTFEGVEKKAVWMPLTNGMHLNVTVPVDEINAVWKTWAIVLIIVFAAILVVFIVFTLLFTGRITKPLRQLTEVAEQVDGGNYDAKMDYKGKDEVGILSRTFNRLTGHLKTYIGNLNVLAYADALTSLRNKGAFDIFLNNLQQEINEKGIQPEFAVCVFDCNNLKTVNDQYGHDKGDLYLKGTATAICDVFDHSPVFRIGGDEFAVLLMNADFEKRDDLLYRFDVNCEVTRAQNTNLWEQISVARGIAVYDPEEDHTVDEVVRRADRAMYENKFRMKNNCR